MNRMGPWPHIIDCLRASTPRTAHSTRKPATLARCSPAPNATTHTASIRHIEWQTMHTIRVSWSDPTLGQCHDQTWRAGSARTEGVCVLTGVPVRRGDAVFRPLALGRDAPVNAPHMILANTLRQDKPGVARQNPGRSVCRIVVPETLRRGESLAQLDHRTRELVAYVECTRDPRFPVAGPRRWKIKLNRDRRVNRSSGVDRNLPAVANSESSSIAPGACANPPSCAAAARPGLRYRYR
jgi:hypothetical protein